MAADESGSLLEPHDWEAFRREAHSALDVAIDHVRGRQDMPVWRELPAIAREVDARKPAVFSVGTFDAGNRFNIIAGSAELTGTVRTLEPSVRDQVEAAISRIVDGVCTAHRATCEVDYRRFTPVLVNDPALSRSSVEILQSMLGEEAVFEAVPIMAAEDFAESAAVWPGFFFMLGVGNTEKGWTSYVHTPTFQPDEEALKVGVRAASALLLGRLAARE